MTESTMASRGRISSLSATGTAPRDGFKKGCGSNKSTGRRLLWIQSSHKSAAGTKVDKDGVVA
jgi:hypothetical protein